MTEPTQRCPRCTETLPLDAFPERYRGKPGNYCTECARAYRRAWERANRKPEVRPTCATIDCTTTVAGGRTHCAKHHPRPPRPAPVRSTTYRAVHQRLTRQRGKASGHTCPCGAPAEQWAYNHTDPAPLSQEWNGKTVTYSADLDRYDALCRGCHVRRDGNGYEGGPLHRMNMARAGHDPAPQPRAWW